MAPELEWQIAAGRMAAAGKCSNRGSGQGRGARAVGGGRSGVRLCGDYGDVKPRRDRRRHGQRRSIGGQREGGQGAGDGADRASGLAVLAVVVIVVVCLRDGRK